MKRKNGRLISGRLINRKTSTSYFMDTFDPAGAYTGSYIGYDDEYYEPEQDADDL